MFDYVHFYIFDVSVMEGMSCFRVISLNDVVLFLANQIMVIKVSNDLGVTEQLCCFLTLLCPYLQKKQWTNLQVFDHFIIVELKDLNELFKRHSNKMKKVRYDCLHLEMKSSIMLVKTVFLLKY